MNTVRLLFAALFIGFGPLGASALPTLIDLNLAPGTATNAPGVTAYGRTASERMGTSIHAGDINGDGIADFIAGAEWADVGSPVRTAAGAVYVWFGRSDFTNRLDAAGTDGAPPDLTLWGARTGDHLSAYGGVRVADVNGDGLNELIVGAPQAEGPGLGAADDRGQVYVVLGRTNFPARIDLAGLEGPGADVRISGAGSADELSRNNALATADLNGDGRLDLVMGAQLADGPGNLRNNAGEAYVVYGRSLFPATLNLASEADLTLLGGSSSDFLTSRGALRTADVNGDGIADLVVGAPTADGPGDARSNAGEAYLIFGRTNFPAVLDLALPGHAGASVTLVAGVDDQLTFADALAVGDVNGDGLPDILLSAPFADGPSESRPGAGEAWIVFGRSDTNDYPAVVDLTLTGAGGADVVLHGATAGDELNGSESSMVIGDVTGDGIADLLLTARLGDGFLDQRSNAGEVYLVIGRTNFPSTLDLGTPGDSGASTTIYGETGRGTLPGNNKLALGDLNMDGVADILMGYSADQGNRACVVLGRKSPDFFPFFVDLAQQGYNGADVTLTTSSFSLNGGPIAADLNGDGAEDLLLSASIRSGPGGTRSSAGQAYIILGDPRASGFGLGVGAMQYRVEPPVAGESGFFVAPGATLSANPGGLDGATLALSITSGYEAAADRFRIGANPALAGNGFTSSAASGSGIVLVHQGVPFGTASAVGSAFNAAFNAQATAEAVTALLGHLRYENSVFSEEWFENADNVYSSRTIRVVFAVPGVPEQTQTQVITFPRIVALEAPASRLTMQVIGEDLQKLQVCLSARLDTGERLENPVNLAVSWSSTGLRPNQNDGAEVVNPTRHCAWFRTTSFDGNEWLVTATSGSKQVVFTMVDSSGYCAVLELIASILMSQLPALGGGGTPPALELSAASLHALEALMRTTPEGRRLSDLYRQHTFEVVSLFLAHPALRDQAAAVLLDHQDAILALLAGQGGAEVLTQEIVNRLAALWGALKAVAGPELRAALQAEEDRLHGFQDLVEKTMTQAAGLNGVAAPAEPFVRISRTSPAANQVVLDANAPSGVTPTLWRSPDLLSWIPVPNFQVQTTNSTFRLTDPAPPAGPVLYQIRW